MTSSIQWHGRQSQISQLSVLLSPSFASPSTIVIHGSEGTGKSAITKAHLETSGSSHAIIQCDECITGRHLLERTAAVCASVIKGPSTVAQQRQSPLRCENLCAFGNTLEALLEQSERFVLVFDGIDRQREAPPTLLPALARLGKTIPGLTVVLILTHPNPRFLHTTGVPHVYFPPYNREQSVTILSEQPSRIFLRAPSPSTGYSEESAAEDDAWLWIRFCQAVWDSLAKGAARDLVTFRDITERLWRRFVQPVVDGTFGTRDFSRLLVAQRKLLQEESCLVDEIIPVAQTASIPSTQVTHELPYYSKWLLCAAYLASFNPARQDALYFMKATERKRRKKGGGTAAGRASKHRKIPRHLLSPSSFSLDRLFAILQAVLPHHLVSTIDLYTQVATLGSLRLLLRSGVVSSDILEPGSKWKVNFGWDYAHKLARSLAFEITDYVAE